MSEHPINGLMQTAMENIKDMVDVNTIVGEPVQTPDGSVILPISKVGFGFAAGGSEFSAEEQNMQTPGNRLGTDAHNAAVQLPFGGGSGGGVSITPIAFLVVGSQGVKVVPLDNQTHILERLIESAPQWVEKVRSLIQGGAQQAGMMAGGMQQPGMMSGGMQQPGMMSGGMQQSGMMSGGMSQSGMGMTGTQPTGTGMGGTQSTGTGMGGTQPMGTQQTSGMSQGGAQQTSGGTNTVPIAPNPTKKTH